jgi:Txe/YoeB family toxin of Txe-Axe toxin-antitoxin module
MKQRCFSCNKIGRAQCDGCIHRFCLEHYTEHRHQLDEQFKQIFNEQKALFNKMNHPYPSSKSIHSKVNSLINEINRWEHTTLKLVEKTARVAREKIHELIAPYTKIAEDELYHLSKELRQRKEDHDYFEQDIERLRKKLQQILKDIQVDPPQIQIVKKFIDWSKILRVTPEISSSNIYPAKQQFFYGGTLLTLEHQIQLNQFYGNQNQKWRLIYKATRDGFTANDFHRCSDGKGPTLTLIQSTDEFLFGGYTAINWNKRTKGWTNDKTAFIFTLINPYNIIPTKYTINQNGQDAVFSGGNGPVFGSIDIHINSNSNRNNQNYIMFPRSYHDTTGKGHGTFTNTDVFSTLDIEVYRLFTIQELEWSLSRLSS